MSTLVCTRSGRPAARWLAVIAVVAIGALVGAGGCGSSSVPPPPPGGAPPPPPPPKPSAVASVSADAPKLVFSDADFTESDNSRDPFHNFAKLFAPTVGSVSAPQYDVVLEKFGIDELKLVAIVKSNEGMRAMFVDPQTKGWVVKRGQHLGKGEIVRLGAGISSAYPLYWKIDQIKDGSVVLLREDSLHPEVPPTYREIPLHVEGEKT